VQGVQRCRGAEGEAGRSGEKLGEAGRSGEEWVGVGRRTPAAVGYRIGLTAWETRLQTARTYQRFIAENANTVGLTSCSKSAYASLISSM